MKKLNEKQLLKKIEEKFEDVSSYVYSNINDGVDNIFGKVDTVEDVGGGEGDGETRYIVRHFVDHDLYLRTNGYYASHYGEDWENGFGEFVKPVQRMVTFYE